MQTSQLRAARSGVSASRVLFRRPISAPRPVAIVRATEPARGDDEAAPTTSGSTVFWKGRSYTPSEWETANRTGVFGPAQPNASSGAPVAVLAQPPSATPSFTEVMGFGGAAPEIVNGRLAMLGFVAALFAELSSGQPVLNQFWQEPTLVTLAFTLFIVGSLVPMFQRVPREAFGPFTPSRELINGRAAMIGFASLVAIEAVKGSALF